MLATKILSFVLAPEFPFSRCNMYLQRKWYLNAVQDSGPGSMMRKEADSHWVGQVSGCATHCNAHMMSLKHNDPRWEQALAEGGRCSHFVRTLEAQLALCNDRSLGGKPPVKSNQCWASTSVCSMSCWQAAVDHRLARSRTIQKEYMFALLRASGCRKKQ